jgi:hypothetical protein
MLSESRVGGNIHSQPFTASVSGTSSRDATVIAAEAKLDALVALVATTTLTTTLAGAGSQGAMQEEAEAQAAVPQGSLQAALPPPPLVPTVSSTRALTATPQSRSQQARHRLARAGLTGARNNRPRPNLLPLCKSCICRRHAGWSNVFLTVSPRHAA